ncbi:MAG: hypothetical protein IJQ90_02905 [Alphaproteobacteria bacterium]|nr:hypothetical protein [Alphaproteobacteria bacterium]
MKKFLMYLIIWTFALPCDAVQIKQIGGSNDGMDYLRNEIIKLENNLANKTEKLNECAEKNKNFQIAGIATVGLAGVGVATNISLYSKMKDQVKQGEQMDTYIKNAEADWAKFEQGFNEWSKNLDEQCFSNYYNTQLTHRERTRFEDLYIHRYNIEKYIGDDISESDKTLFIKMAQGMRKCQKQKE